MWWAVAMALVAGCGRFGFDPLGNGGAPGGVDSQGTGDGTGNDTGNDTGGASSHYIGGGTYSNTAPVTSISTMTGPLIDTNMLLVVAIHWNNATSSVATVQDGFGNGFTMVGGMRRYNSAQSQVIWFKKVTAGTTINVLFAQATPSVDLQWAAYREIDQMSPIGSDISSAGTSTTADSGALNLASSAVVVSSSASQALDAEAGAGFTPRQRTNGGVLEDLEAGPGVVNATATLSSSNDWIIHAFALRPH